MGRLLILLTGLVLFAGCMDEDCPKGQVSFAGGCVACNADDDCNSGHCSPSHDCVMCLESEHCPGDAVCSGQYTCVACNNDADCSYGWCGDEVCQGLLGFGSECDRDAQCVTLNCHEGVCLGNPGEGCQDAPECESGFCTDGVCCLEACDSPCERCSATGECEPVAAGHDNDCWSFCVDGVCQKCPEEMRDTGTACMDLHEAPNIAGALPFVMFTFNESEAWCIDRGKRLCLDTEWTSVCEGPGG
ncbi:hypothetical protein KJ865_12495, partial [Myxococcota bacterium]|nr:hypothetical protein [Myxococcota bacterium]